MRKNFLILMLLSLLPLAGWAQGQQQTEVTVTLYDFTITYGDDEPTAATLPSSAYSISGDNVNWNDIDEYFTFTRENTSANRGSYDYTLIQAANTGNYIIHLQTKNAKMTIAPKTLTSEMIGDISGTYTFDNTEKQPTPAVTFNGVTLTAGTDFTYEYGENVHAGNNAGVVKIKASSNTNFVDAAQEANIAKKTFTIGQLALSTVTVSAIPSQTFTRSAITPALEVKGKDESNNEYTLRLTDDYTASYADNTNAGTAKVGVAPAQAGDFTFNEITTQSADVTFTIDKKAVTGDANIVIVGLVNKNYTDADHTQANNNNLKINWTQGEGDNATTTDIANDFDLSYSNNTNVGIATITATAKENSNYTGAVTGTYNILPGSIANATIEFKKMNGQNEEAAVYTYTGSEIKPGTNEGDGYLKVTVGGTALVKGTDYAIVSYGDNYEDNNNNITGDNTNASVANEKTASVTIKGINNYAAVDENGDDITVTEGFSIGKLTLALTAKSGVSVSYGVSPDSQFGYTSNVATGDDLGIASVTYKVYNGQNEENVHTALAVSTDTYTYKVDEVTLLPDNAPQNVDNPVEGTDYASAAQKAARLNYDLTNITKNAANITITAATLVIVPDNMSKKYGSNDPATFTYKVYNGSVDANNLMDHTDNGFWTVEPVLAREEGENYAQNGYTISVTNAPGDNVQNAVAKTGYTITCNTGTFTINKFNITVTANDQTIIYGSAPNLETTDNSLVKAVTNGVEGYGQEKTVTFTPAFTGNQTAISRTDLQLALEWNESTNALTPAVGNANFAATIVPGTVTIVPAAAVTFDRTATATTQIANYANQQVNVKISTTTDPRTLYANAWNALVLPFTISPKQFIEATGAYAVFDLLEAGGNAMNFKISIKSIPAYTPFLVKVDTEIDLSTKTFAGVTVLPIDEAKLTQSLSETANYKFVGTLKAGSVDGPTWDIYPNEETGKVQLNPHSGAHNKKAFSAYFTTIDGSNPYSTAPQIFIEEPDGSTTAIGAITAEGVAVPAEGWYNLNGVKLNGMPTEKGIYINNGKKLVVK